MPTNLKYAATLKNRQQDALNTELGGNALFDIIAGTQKANPDTPIGSSTLSAGYTAGGGTLSITNGITNFPASGSFEVKVDNEWFLVTGGQGTNTWTVTGAQRGTVAANHSSGATVTDGVVLATLTGNATYAPAASGGVATLNSITPGTGSAAAGAGTTANWFRQKTSGSVPKIDGTCGPTSGYDLNFVGTASIATGQTVSVASWTFANGN